MTPAHVLLVIITLLLHCTVDAQVLRGTVVGPTGPSGVNGFGAAIVAVKDVAGDGAMDFAVSDPSHFAVQGFLMPPRGRVWVHSGSSLQLISTLDPTAGQTGFASRLRSAGDADGDGNGDLIVGGRGPPTSLFLPFTQQRFVVSIQPTATLRTFTTATSNINLTVNNLNVWSIGDRNLPQAYVYSLAPAGVTYFGTGCPSIDGALPTLGVTGQALSGSGVDFPLGNVPPFGLGVLIIGVSNAFWGPIILPFDLGVIGLPGCDLLVSADFFDFALIDAVGQKGVASFGYTFAAGLPLTGFTFYGQWSVENPPGSPLPYQLSNAQA